LSEFTSPYNKGSLRGHQVDPSPAIVKVNIQWSYNLHTSTYLLRILLITFPLEGDGIVAENSS